MSKTATKQSTKKQNKPQPAGKKDKTTRLDIRLIQRVMTAPDLLSAGEMRHLQGIIGNAQVQRMMDGHGRGVIQRLLPDSTALIKVGGKAGFKLRGKTSYKIILEAVDAYNGISYEAFDERTAKLTELGEAISNWFNSPERAKKTGKKKRADERKAEMLQGLLLIVNQEIHKVGQQQIEYEEQAHQERMGEIGDKAANLLKAKAGGRAKGFKEEEQKQKEADPEGHPDILDISNKSPEELKDLALAYYTKDMDKIKAGGKNAENKIIEGRAPVAQDWRTDSQTTKLAANLGELVGRNYFKTVILPAFSPVIRTPNKDVEIDPYKIQDVPENLKAGVIQQNAQRLMGLYGNVMDLFSEGGASVVPDLFAIFCAQLNQLALNKGMEENEAYLLTSSQIFLRFINPMVISLTSSIGFGEPGKAASLYIAKMLQNDANRVQHSTKQAFLSVVDAANYQEQIETFIAAIIERGQQLQQQD